MAARRLKLGTPLEVRQSIARLANLTLNGQLEPKAANACLYACSLALNAIKAGAMQAQLDELEKKMEGLHDGGIT